MFQVITNFYVTLYYNLCPTPSTNLIYLTPTHPSASYKRWFHLRFCRFDGRRRHCTVFVGPSI